MTKKLTVIMSSYNQANYISKAIDSVLAQKTSFDIQLIITDDHSTKDNTVEIIKSYQKKYPDKIKLILHEENGRYLKNILSAKSITETPYFTLLDADDYWTDENYLQKGVTFLEKHPNHTIYSTNVMIVDENGNTRPFLKTSATEKDFSIKDFIEGKALVPQTTGMLFRNVVYKDGIPEIIQNSIGTPAERSYEGDFARYMMHIERGLAHYVNEFSGVYQLLSSGIWVRLSMFERYAITARTYLDWYIYLDKKYQEELFTKARESIMQAISHLIKDSRTNFGDYCKEAQNAFFYTLSFLKLNESESSLRKKTLKDRLFSNLLKRTIRYFTKNNK